MFCGYNKKKCHFANPELVYSHEPPPEMQKGKKGSDQMHTGPCPRALYSVCQSIQISSPMTMQLAWFTACLSDI